MINSLEYTSLQISDFYNATRNSLAVSLQRISSGKKVIDPKDNIGSFMHLQRIQQTKRGYNTLADGLTAAASMVDLGEKAATQVVDTIKRMKELIVTYHSNLNSPEGQAADNAEFDGLKASLDTIKAQTWFQGKNLFTAGTMASVLIDPNNFSNTLDITFAAGDIFDTAAMDINGGGDQNTAMATVDPQLDAALSYLGKVTAYKRAVESQQNLMFSIVQNGDAYASAVNNVDDGEELSKVVDYDIRQQAALSMLAQANSYRTSILKLIEG